MRKFLIGILLFVMCLSLVGCSSKKEVEDDANDIDINEVEDYEETIEDDDDMEENLGDEEESFTDIFDDDKEDYDE